MTSDNRVRGYLTVPVRASSLDDAREQATKVYRVFVGDETAELPWSTVYRADTAIVNTSSGDGTVVSVGIEHFEVTIEISWEVGR